MTAYLVTVPGLRGPEQQIWYGDGRAFVGPKLEVLEKHELPRWWMQGGSIEEAKRHAT